MWDSSTTLWFSKEATCDFLGAPRSGFSTHELKLRTAVSADHDPDEDATTDASGATQHAAIGLVDEPQVETQADDICYCEQCERQISCFREACRVCGAERR